MCQTQAKMLPKSPNRVKAIRIASNRARIATESRPPNPPGWLRSCHRAPSLRLFLTPPPHSNQRFHHFFPYVFIRNPFALLHICPITSPSFTLFIPPSFPSTSFAFPSTQLVLSTRLSYLSTSRQACKGKQSFSETGSPRANSQRRL